MSKPFSQFIVAHFALRAVERGSRAEALLWRERLHRRVDRARAGGRNLVTRRIFVATNDGERIDLTDAEAAMVIEMLENEIAEGLLDEASA